MRERVTQSSEVLPGPTTPTARRGRPVAVVGAVQRPSDRGASRKRHSALVAQRGPKPEETVCGYCGRTGAILWRPVLSTMAQTAIVPYAYPKSTFLHVACCLKVTGKVKRAFVRRGICKADRVDGAI